jgi:hypothetical protein
MLISLDGFIAIIIKTGGNVRYYWWSEITALIFKTDYTEPAKDQDERNCDPRSLSVERRRASSEASKKLENPCRIATGSQVR